MENIYKCPKCGEKDNLHFNYDYSKQHRPIKDILCNQCGESFDGNIPLTNIVSKEPKQTAVQVYISTLRNYKKINGSIDDAIVIAETLLLELEKRQIIESYNQDLYGGLNGGRKFNDGEEYYNETYKK